jgi:hypothetical protein
MAEAGKPEQYPKDPGPVTDAPLYDACYDRGCLCGGQEETGFVETCEESGVSFAGARVVLVGAGGAAAAILAGRPGAENVDRGGTGRGGHERGAVFALLGDVA